MAEASKGSDIVCAPVGRDIELVAPQAERVLVIEMRNSSAIAQSVVTKSRDERALVPAVTPRAPDN
jgi:hypothetical protein